MFIQYLAEQGAKALAAERKARKTLQYKDLGELQFSNSHRVLESLTII
jgi:hypothetical protein